MRRIVFSTATAVLILAPITAFAANYTLTPIPSAGQSVRYDRGSAILTSEMSGSALSVIPLAPELGGTLSLSLKVVNKSGQSFNVDPANIRITTESGKTVKIYTYDELVGRVKRAAGWQAFAVALAGGLQTYANSQPTTVYSNGSSTAYSGRYSASANYSSTTRIYNNSATQMANMETSRQTASMLDQVSANADRTSDSLKVRVLQITTLDGNYSMDAQIIADISSLSKRELEGLTMSVTLGGDTHVMRFSGVKTNITNRADRPPEPPTQYARQEGNVRSPSPARQQAAGPAAPALVDGIVYTPYVPAQQ